jgi:hypothetical protein
MSYTIGHLRQKANPAAAVEGIPAKETGVSLFFTE